MVGGGNGPEEPPLADSGQQPSSSSFSSGEGPGSSSACSSCSSSAPCDRPRQPLPPPRRDPRVS